MCSLYDCFFLDCHFEFRSSNVNGACPPRGIFFILNLVGTREDGGGGTSSKKNNAFLRETEHFEGKLAGLKSIFHP